MECPICEQELIYVDYFGRICRHQDGHVEGDIYQCQNEDCVLFEEYFYTYRRAPNDLHSGYPC